MTEDMRAVRRQQNAQRMRRARANLVNKRRSQINQRRRQPGASLLNNDPPRPIAFYNIDDFNESVQPEEHLLPPMNSECPHCGAFLFPSELNTAQICCMKGKIVLPAPTPPPDTMIPYFTVDDDIGKEFRTKIRAYNSAFSFISLGV